ncbi:MAG: tRNA (adenosine(37)-N6)-threonylcarbamoyltransferase complex dimerization subunit type 1 TsaB [Desulfobulbaceae bacterium]|nr:tRNA (adenosine(37)-N6)-threonylcarbamoyltransferase complex dimerization subunit type 1 TsaB [Desulfobulbaceae bacterium]
MADVLILAIETATGCGSVSLTAGDSRNGKVLAEYTLQPETTHSRRLLGLVEAMMVAAGTNWTDLDGVAVSQGPGSFTGLRIGMAAAKGIAMAAGVPLIGVSTLDGLAAQVPALDLPVCCLLDARKQQVYAAFYRYSDDFSCRRIGEPQVLSPEALVQRIQEPTLVAGPGIVACFAQLAAHRQARVLPAGTIHPRAALIGFCGASILATGAAGNGADLVPWYVRASEAELNLQ